MGQSSKRQSERLNQEIITFSRHIAGSCKIVAAFLSGYSGSDTFSRRRATHVLLVIEDFQPRLMNYVKVLDGHNVLILAADKWIFERDVDRGLLGEALASRLIFPYETLVNEEYLHASEVALKKRLVLELLQSLVLDFPELSHEFYIEPEYFMYETLLTRARLFPPMFDSLSNLVKESRNLRQTLKGFLEALKKLEKEMVLSFSGNYVTISKEFIDGTRGRKVRFTSLFKTGHRALFASLLGMLPQAMNVLSQNMESRLDIQRLFAQATRTKSPIEDPEVYVHVGTARGLVPLANRVSIADFSRRIFSARSDAHVEVKSMRGFLNDVYLVTVNVDGKERKTVVKRFRDWSSFKWFPLTLWSVGTKSFAVLGNSRLERECAINRLLHSYGFAVPEVLYVSANERLIFMEFVAGEELTKVVRKIVGSKSDSGLSRELKLIEKVGSLLAKVHSLGVALGDTKPENVLIDKKGELYITDLEQAGRNGDKVWDVAEFLYYAGHEVSPFAGAYGVEMMAKAFIKGYLQAGGDVKTVKSAGNPKYTKVFSVFTFPNIILSLSSLCRNADTLKK